MRKCGRILALMIVFIGMSQVEAAAQNTAIERGSLLIIGGLSFTSSGGDLYLGDDDRVSTLRINQSFGGFLAHGFALTGAADVSRISGGGTTIHDLSVGPDFTYFADTGSAAVPFFRGSVRLIAFGADNGNTNIDETGFGFEAGGGVAVLLSQHLALGFGLDYVYERYSIEGVSEAITGNTIVVSMSLLGFIH